MIATAADGTVTGIAVTDCSGAYSIPVPPGWSGSLAGSLHGYRFAPVSRAVSDAQVDIGGLDFAATAGNVTISGTIRDGSGVGLGGVRLSVGDNDTGMVYTYYTIGDGTYSFQVPGSWNGSVVVSKDGYDFTPQYRSYTNVLEDLPGQNYNESSGDTVPPVISSVTALPAKAAAGDPVTVTVVATDNVGVTSVLAGTTALTHTGGDTWTGTITAPATLGSQPVSVTASDAVGNSTPGSTSYTVVRSFGVTNSSAATIASGGTASYLYTVWGRVSGVTTGSFMLDDGSGKPVKVLATGHGLTDGDYASARGELVNSVNPPELTAHVVRKLD